MPQPVTCTHGRTLFQVCELCHKETTMTTTCDRCHATVLVTTHHGTRDLCLACVEELSGWYAMNFADVTEAAQRRIEMARAALAAATLALALALSTTHGGAAHTGGRYDYPIIGTPAYDAGCVVTQDWEDGSAYAYCAEDGAWYVHDPDGQSVPNIPDNPMRSPGWYVIDPR